MKGRFGRSLDSHIETAAEIVLSEWEVGLFRFLTETTIVNVCHYANHFDIRFRISSIPLTDSSAEWAPPSEIPLRKSLVDDCGPRAVRARGQGITIIEVPA